MNTNSPNDQPDAPTPEVKPLQRWYWTQFGMLANLADEIVDDPFIVASEADARIAEKDAELSRAHGLFNTINQALFTAQQTIAELTSQRDAARAAVEEIAKKTHHALERLTKAPEMPAEYQEQLDRCNWWIQRCKDDGNDWYGVNFHQGMRSGIIFAQCVESKRKEELRSQLTTQTARAEAAEKLSKDIKGANTSICETMSKMAQASITLETELADARQELEELKKLMQEKTAPESWNILYDTQIALRDQLATLQAKLAEYEKQ